MMRKDTNKIGKDAEQLARQYLEQKKLHFIQANFNCKLGEIDLIMRDRETLCFIEVRYRRSSHFGTAAESIDHRKQQKLFRTAQIYLQQNTATEIPCRFDVISIQGPLNKACINWIKNAF